MVADYYKLREAPFGVTPDPRYLFLSATHREALASLLYGVKAGRGFVALVAVPGMGSAGWLPKIAMTSAVLLLSGWALFGSHRQATGNASAQMSNATPPQVSHDCSFISYLRLTRPVVQTSAIRVMPGQTLYRFCAEHFETCKPELLQKDSCAQS